MLIFIWNSTEFYTVKLALKRIVIPVVVGSSPISHPSIQKACCSQQAFYLRVAAWLVLLSNKVQINR